MIYVTVTKMKPETKLFWYLPQKVTTRPWVVPSE